MLSTVSRDQILEIICRWNALRLGGSEEVPSNRICVIAEGDLDWTLEAMQVTVVASSLVCLVLSHQWDELVCGPSLGLEVIVVRS